MRWACVAMLLVGAAHASAQDTAFLGDWQEPGGSVVRIERCGDELCMRLRVLSPNAPATTDAHNPDASLRARSLCDLQIGSGFHVYDAAHASQGRLYDPRSGNTYRGRMTLEGDTLSLRGYLGISLLGRTEMWHRTHATDAHCIAAAK